MRGQRIDRLELHKMLWKRADRFGKVEIHQGRLSEELHVTKPTMSLIMTELTQEGRVKKVGSKYRNVGVYTIRNPVDFPHIFDGKRVPGIGVKRCTHCGELEVIGKHTLPIV